MAIIPKCEYCKHNEGENKKLRFMWHCKILGYCVPFGYGRKMHPKEPLQHCEAMFLGKGAFEVDEVKYRESKIDSTKYKNKENENITD